MESIDWNAWTAIVTTSLILFVGVLFTVIPVIPGTLIVWLGVLLHRVWMGPEASVTWTFILIGLTVVVFAQVLDILMTYWGAKRFGASWKGALGAALGGIVGLSLGPLGMIAGTFLGAVLFEWLNVRDHCRAVKAGVGTLVGTLAAMFAKLGLSVGLALCFYFYLPTFPWRG